MGTQEIFNISVTEIESIVEPNCVADDVRRESMTLYVFMDRFKQALPVNLPIPSVWHGCCLIKIMDILVHFANGP